MACVVRRHNDDGVVGIADRRLLFAKQERQADDRDQREDQKRAFHGRNPVILSGTKDP